MARTCKKGIDYFSHDTSMSNDFKVKMIQAKHGIIAYAVYNKLLERLYDENGYWLHIDEDVNILFCNDNIIEIDVYILIINECINYGLFDSQLYEHYSILTSARIQRNYCEAVKRRKQVDFIDEYLLLKKDDVHMKDLNVNILTLNADIGTQKKGKEIKKKEKQKETTPKKPKPDPSVQALELAQLLFNKILERDSKHKKPDFKKWANEIDKINRLDNRTFEQIKYIINFSQNDDFWKNNILSGAKLRSNFGQLVVKAKEQRKPKKKFQTQTEKNDEFFAKMNKQFEQEKKDARNNNAGDAIVLKRV